MLLTKEEQIQFATLINTVIDIPLVPESLEQQIFEHAVSVIDQVLQDTLPTILHGLLREAGNGIDKDHAKTFADRLVQTTNNKFDLPYLNEDQEAQVLRLVIDPLVKAMTDGKTLERILPAVKSISDYSPRG
jgi:hypothetical protein